MAGGKGKRLREVISDVPKPLAPIRGRPLIDYIIEHTKRYGCDNIIVTTEYLGEKIEEHIKNNDYGIKIKISRETTPLGNAGSLLLLKDLLEEEFFVLYGDVFTTINLSKMLKFHKEKNSDATIAIHKSDHPQDSTVVQTEKDGRVLSMVEKPGDNWEKYGNLTITPVYILKKDVLDLIQRGKEINISKDIFPEMIRAGKKLFGYLTSEYAKDIGTPERYQKVQDYVKILSNS